MRIGINGFGRIGRNFLKASLQRHPDLEVVAVNELAPAETCAHLLRHDSTYGRYPHEVRATQGALEVQGRRLQLSAERDPANVPWREAGVELVIEATGLFTDAKAAQGHLGGKGARKVIISAPAKNEDLTVVVGVNHEAYAPAAHHVVSAASCTTNALAVVLDPLVDAFGWKRGFMTTVHSYTSDQGLLDGPHRDVRRARSAAVNIVPTSSGAAKALYLAVPATKGAFDGFSLRVPTATVSIIYLVAQLGRDATQQSLNDVLRAAAATGPLHNILAVEDAPLVSSDFRGSPYSAVVDAGLTQAMGDLVQLCAWYDNEWAYACRLGDLAAHLVARG